MPTSLKLQSLLPLVGKIVACNGMVSPIFQPNFFANAAPTMAPSRVVSKALRCAAGKAYSGYMSKNPGPTDMFVGLLDVPYLGTVRAGFQREPLGLERNRGWLGRDVETLVDRIVPPRTHEHEDGDGSGDGEPHGPAVEEGSDLVRLSGRTRQNKLVHLIGPADSVGSLVGVRIEHAGPYALRGILGPMASGASPRSSESES